jgi:hypothetical protein
MICQPVLPATLQAAGLTSTFGTLKISFPAKTKQ